MFRGKYRAIFVLSFSFLIINTLVVLFNKDLYRFIDNPKKHFVYKYHIAKELAHELKSKSIDCIDTNYKMQHRLHFYGVTKCDNYILSKIQRDDAKQMNVTIGYRDKPVFSSYVTKVNN